MKNPPPSLPSILAFSALTIVTYLALPRTSCRYSSRKISLLSLAHPRVCDTIPTVIIIIIIIEGGGRACVCVDGHRSHTRKTLRPHQSGIVIDFVLMSCQFTSSVEELCTFLSFIRRKALPPWSAHFLVFFWSLPLKGPFRHVSIRRRCHSAGRYRIDLHLVSSSLIINNRPCCGVDSSPPHCPYGFKSLVVGSWKDGRSTQFLVNCLINT